MSLDETQPPVAAGDVIAEKYRVETVLGRGGMGVVVSAQHLQLGQRVAIKFLLVEPTRSPDAVERFLREARAAVRIQSEHVARVIDVGTLPTGAPFMVMEFLVGCDLAELVRNEGPQPIPRVVDLILQAGEAIAEAHAKGIIHRDLKPANLFLSQRPDGTALVKVLDFGISKSSTTDESGGQQASMTATTAVMGSPLYMSPEQMRSTKNVDARTDIWSLGVILFELLTGRPVYEADSLPGLCAMIATDPAPPLRSLRPDAPPELEKVVDSCLSKKKSGRPQSMAEFAIALAPFGTQSARFSAQRIHGVLAASLSLRPPPLSKQASTLTIGQAASGHDPIPGASGKTVDGWGTTAEHGSKNSRTPWMLAGATVFVGVCLAIAGVFLWAPWSVSDVDAAGTVPVADDDSMTGTLPLHTSPPPLPVATTETAPAASTSAPAPPPEPIATSVPKQPRMPPRTTAGTTPEKPPEKPPKTGPTTTPVSTTNESDVLNERR